jgi:ubiquinone/menaquinone biosynthesis C-methylase UbiE
METEVAFRNYHDELFRIFEDSFISPSDILDVGCGDKSRWSQFFSVFLNSKDCASRASHVIGTDVHFEGGRGRTKGELHSVVSDARCLPFRDKLDIVFEKDALHHINNYEIASKEIKRVSKKGGKVIVVEANRYNSLSYIHMIPLNGHEHFTQTFFQFLIKNTFSQVNFDSKEIHVYPFHLQLMLSAIREISNMSEKIPYVNKLI